MGLVKRMLYVVMFISGILSIILFGIIAVPIAVLSFIEWLCCGTDHIMVNTTHKLLDYGHWILYENGMSHLAE